MSALFAFTGTMHFVTPSAFEEIVPPALGHERFWVLSSGAAELVLAMLLWATKTRRIGALLSIALLIGVFPANIYMAMQAQGDRAREVATLARLPLQPLLVYWAWRISVRSANTPRAK